jgi:CheY-specific phosphatase CheX
MTIAAASFAYVRELLHRRSAIYLEAGKEYLVESRLQPIVQASGEGTLDRLVSRLRSSPEGSLHAQVVEAMTTNETSWFRDRHPYDAFESVILPDLLSCRAEERRLTVWSAATASGQEAYSIAMVLHERLAADPGWDVRVLASDLSEQMVRRTRAGRYSQLEINRGLPAARLVRHFSRAGNRMAGQRAAAAAGRGQAAEPRRPVPAVAADRRDVPSQRPHLLPGGQQAADPAAGPPGPAARRLPAPRYGRDHPRRGRLRTRATRQGHGVPPPWRTGASMTDEEILGITRDVWESFTGRTIELADDQVRPDGGDVTVGCVTVTGEWQGNVLLACPAQLARMAASAMFDLPAAQLDDEQVADALGELTNMIGGNLKSLIPGPSRLSMPTVTVGASSTLPMPHAALLSTVSLACEGLPLTVSVWRMRADRLAG